MADEPEDTRTLKEKLLFYTTTFFVLLGTFSLFAFLFLVPFVIDPAFTTIFMQFDTNPAFCVTSEIVNRKGASNCSWTSCKEGCTKDVYECTQIRVNYKTHGKFFLNETIDPLTAEISEKTKTRYERAVKEYDEDIDNTILDVVDLNKIPDDLNTQFEYSDATPGYGLQGNNSEWFFFGARFFPNVKGCGYPPMLNCTIWKNKYIKLGTNFSCYYSKVDPSVVISDLDMHQNTLNLVYAMAIPIPSFIISVIYLTFAYFKIYNEDEESVPLDQNAEGIDGEDEDGDEEHEENMTTSETQLPNGGTTTQLPQSGPLLTPNSDLASFGHQLKVKMVDEMSRDSIDAGLISNSGSIQGNLSKTMTTSISTQPGPIAAV